MSNWLKLEGDVCAVTGALGGMGVEICREFARNGANVVLLDLDEEKVKAAAADLAAEFGIHAEGYKMNATDEAEVQAAVDATIADVGRVVVLVNTAGIRRFALAMDDGSECPVSQHRYLDIADAVDRAAERALPRS